MMICLKFPMEISRIQNILTWQLSSDIFISGNTATVNWFVVSTVSTRVVIK